MDQVLFLSLLALLLLQPSSASGSYTTAGNLLDDVKDPTWDYANFSSWPKLCQKGTMQSPVSFSELAAHEVVYSKSLKPLQFSRKCTFAGHQTSLKITNEVNTMSARLIPLDHLNDSTSLCTTRDPTNADSPLYYFVAMHFHSPAEHVFPHAEPNAELHLVFSTRNNSRRVHRMVVAVQLVASDTINTTSARALFHMLLDGELPPKHAITTSTLAKEMSIPGFLPQRGSYLAYEGSLTTPPCTEGIRFIVMTSPQIISTLALERLRRALNQARPENHQNNRRPTQPLNGRVVYRFVDTVHNKTQSSKGGYMEDYYEMNQLHQDAWGHEEVRLSESHDQINLLHINESNINGTEAQPRHAISWPRPLTLSGAILFTGATLVLLVVSILLYRRVCAVATSATGTDEVDPFAQLHKGYGTASA